MAIENEKELDSILGAFDRAGFLPDVILIGSWCLSFYTRLFRGFDPSIRTTDIDFYVPDAKSANAALVSDNLHEINYDHFQDTLTHKSRFVSPHGFEVEFLARLNRDGLSCVRIGKSGIFAESISYVDIFGTNFIEVEWNGKKVKVASPSAYAIQKMLINDRRKEKAEKDAASIDYVLSFIRGSRKSSEDFYELFDRLPKKWQREIAKYLNRRKQEFPQRIVNK